MALQKRSVAIQFAQGIDTKTDAKQVLPGKLVDLQNAVFLKNGTVSKRNGYDARGQIVDGSGGAAYRNAQGLGARGDELLLFANATSLSYRPSSDTWSQGQAVSSVVASSDVVARTGTDQTLPDAATNGGVTVVAWEDNRGGVWAAVLEAASQRILTIPTQLDASGVRPRVVAVGNVLHVLWVNGVILWVATVNPASPGSFGAAVPLTSDLDAGNAVYDACATFDAFDAARRPGLVAWSTPNGYRLAWIHQSGVIGSPATGLPSAGTFLTGSVTGPIAVSLWLTNPNNVSAPEAAVAWCNSNLNYSFFNAVTMVSVQSGVLSAGPVTWNRCTIEFADLVNEQPIAWWAGEVNGATADVNLVRTGSIDGATNLVVGPTIHGHAIASRAYYDAGDVYVALVHPVLFFPYVAVCQLSGSMRAQARLLPGLSAGILARSHLPSAFPMNLGASGSTSRQHAVCLPYRIQLSGSSGTQFGEVGIQLFTLDHDHDDAYRAAQLGRGLYLSGALVQHYDGDRWAEASFHAAPDTASGHIAFSTAGGGALTTAQFYGYKVLYEEIDGQGELHRGAVSTGTIVHLTGGDTSVTLTIPTCRLTSKRRVRIGVFRSLASSTAPTDPEAIEYFRVSSVDPTAGGANGYVLNDPTVDTLSFQDLLADATVGTLEPLYTNGGVLSNDPEESGGEFIVAGKGRLFWIDPLNGNQVNYSQELEIDTAADLSAFLFQLIDPFGGDIVALAVMDDSVVCFKETAIFAFQGPGPAPDGTSVQGDGWTPPRLVTSDVGCKSRSSVVNTPLGVAFQSEKGICLLGRDLQVRRIGDDVWAFRNQRVTRATLIPDRPHVVFLTDAGSTLLWDYDKNQWSRFTNHEGFDAVVVGGVYHYLRTDGRVFAETAGQYADATMQIPMVIETAQVKFSGVLQGWQKVIRALVVGNYVSPHALRMEYKLDYEPAWAAPADHRMDADQTPSNYGVGDDGNYGDGNYQPPAGLQSVTYQRDYHINRRCQAIAFRFSDVDVAQYVNGQTNYTPAALGASFELSELLLTGGAVGAEFKPGANRLG